jgi:hypothetical protein
MNNGKKGRRNYPTFQKKRNAGLLERVSNAEASK